jgi:hypothetical protein
MQSLQRFVFEGTELIKKVLVMYTDTMVLVPPGLVVAFLEYLTQPTVRRILRRTI